MKPFKNIRKSLINGGNIKRYLLYAIGEVLLVMIGISLAFQVDNWNENRLKKDEETSYYQNIRVQIIADKELIQGQMHFNNRYMAQFKYAYAIIEAMDRSKIDTLGLIIRNLTEYSDFDRQGNIYETMVNSGEIKILRNKKIVNGIRNLEEKYIYINRMENIHYDVGMNHVAAILNPILNFATAEIKKPDQVFNYEFQNILINLLRIMTEKNKVYTEAINQIEAIKTLIDSELYNT
jgi:hypothetical protein